MTTPHRQPHFNAFLMSSGHHEAATLREHYGLPRPGSQFTVTRPRGVPVPVP